MTQKTHQDRLFNELKKAGMTPYGFLKLETALLPALIHEDEHIYGVVYGRLHGKIDAVMLVATDKRILYLDCKPFYKDWDEITYEVVSGVRMSTVKPFAGIILHTRVKDYELRFVNQRCAKKFTHYIESYIERVQKEVGLSDKMNPSQGDKPKNSLPPKRTSDSTEEKTIPTSEETLVFATTNPDHSPHQNIVHFLTDEQENFYILSKEKTTKVQNSIKNPRVHLIIHAPHSLKVLSVSGLASVIREKAIVATVFKELVHTRAYAEGEKLPPITTIAAGDYCVIKVTPVSSVTLDYSSSSW